MLCTISLVAKHVVQKRVKMTLTNIIIFELCSAVSNLQIFLQNNKHDFHWLVLKQSKDSINIRSFLLFTNTQTKLTLLN